MCARVITAQTGAGGFDGAIRLALLGGLDIVVVDRLIARLRVLLASRRLVRVDLSGLGFIDCTGLRAIIDAVAAARRNRQPLEVSRPVSAPVKRVITFMNAASLLWPAEGEGARPALRVIDGIRSDGNRTRAAQ